MGNTICCSSEPCQELLTVGYLEDLIPDGHCHKLIKGGESFSACCIDKDDKNSGATVIKNSEKYNYARPRSTNDDDPNNDKSGFEFANITQTYDGCCGSYGSDYMTLIKSDATFGYTEAINNTLTVPLEGAPTICDTNYRVDEEKEYKRYTVRCNGSDGKPSSTSQSVIAHSAHTNDIDGVIQKCYEIHTSKIGNTDIVTGWTGTVTFNPSVKKISGLTSDDCNHTFQDVVTWKFPDNYPIGFTLGGDLVDYLTNNKKIPCDGSVLTFTYSANTKCKCDFMFDYETSNEKGSSDTTVSSKTESGVTYFGYDEDRIAEIASNTVTIEIGRNKNSFKNFILTLSVSAVSISDTDSYPNGKICYDVVSPDTCNTLTSFTQTYIIDRALCAWSAGKVSNPDGCSAYWPEIEVWTNPIDETIENKDVYQIDKNHNKCDECNKKI